ncbi:MAG: hypothetical protein QM726_24720 [Chitinophagaceae bacterium]
MKSFFIIACLSMCFFQCSKPAQDRFSELPGFIQLLRSQTQCGDPWGYGASRDETTQKLTNYLKQKNIEIVKVDWENTGETAVCLACLCSAGSIIHIWAEEKYVDSLFKEGFRKK